LPRPHAAEAEAHANGLTNQIVDAETNQIVDAELEA
jgi:hypothetical protein